MTTSRYCPDPPQLKEDAVWSEYKDDVTAWTAITDLEATKQGLALYLKLNDKSKSIIRDKVRMDDLGKDDGVKRITTELDKIYEKRIKVNIWHVIVFINIGGKKVPV